VNTQNLTKLYDRLTPRERLPLIMAAVERGDHAEAGCLARAAPRIRVGLPDYLGLGEGLILLNLFHLIGQLDLGVLFWHAQAQAADDEAAPAGHPDRERADRLWDVARMMGYKLCVEADAWRQLHAELHLDPDGLHRNLPAYGTLQLIERAARVVPWTAEQAAAYLKRLGPRDAAVPTAEGALKAMRAVLDQRVQWWG
jgi:hypothetical protein